jgi:hypothetical protein
VRIDHAGDDRNAEVPEQANSATVWMGGVIALCAVLALVLFGSPRASNTASNPNLNPAPGMTTGSAPASPAKTRSDHGTRRP